MLSNSNTNKQRLYWQARRGMLELDLLFNHFLNSEYDNLSVLEQQQFADLLAYPDPLLQAWFFAEVKPRETSMQQLVIKIKKQSAIDAINSS